MGEPYEAPPPPPRSRIRPRRRRSSSVLASAAYLLICGTSCAANENQHIPFQKTGTRTKGDVPSFRRPTADPVLPDHSRRILDTTHGNVDDADPMPRPYIIGGTDLSNLAAHPWFAATKFQQTNHHIPGYGTDPTSYGSTHHSQHNYEPPSQTNNINLHAQQSWLGCGASLVARRYVVTAAHCVWDLNQNPYQVASGKEKRRAMDPLRAGLEYRVGFSGYCPDQLVSRNYNNGDNKAAGESRLHEHSYGSPPSMEENCGQPYEDIPAVHIHLHPAHPDFGELVKTHHVTSVLLIYLEVSFMECAVFI